MRPTKNSGRAQKYRSLSTWSPWPDFYREPLQELVKFMFDLSTTSRVKSRYWYCSIVFIISIYMKIYCIVGVVVISAIIIKDEWFWVLSRFGEITHNEDPKIFGLLVVKNIIFVKHIRCTFRKKKKASYILILCVFTHIKKRSELVKHK